MWEDDQSRQDAAGVVQGRLRSSRRRPVVVAFVALLGFSVGAAATLAVVRTSVSRQSVLLASALLGGGTVTPATVLVVQGSVGVAVGLLSAWVLVALVR